MDAYVLGKLDGDLPNHLLEIGSAEDGVRVIARLDGPAHDVYFALVAPTEAAIGTLIDQLGDLGVTEMEKLTRSIAGPQHRTGKVTPFPGNAPTFADPLLYVVFELFDLTDLQEGVEIGEALIAAGQSIGGHEKVAAAMDANNRLLVELTSDSKELLHSAAEALRVRFGGASSGLVWVRGDLWMRSGGSTRA